MEAWLLFIIGIALCVAELVIPTGFFLLIIGLGVLVVGALTFVGLIASWIAQATVFSGVALGIWYLFGDHLQRLLRSGEKEYGGLIGQVVVARESLAPGHKGHGELWGAPWRIENGGAEMIEIGDECHVLASDGLVLRVRKKVS